MKLTAKLKLLASREAKDYQGNDCARLIFLDENNYTREYNAPVESLGAEIGIDYFVTFDFIQGVSKTTGNRFAFLVLKSLKPVK